MPWPDEAELLRRLRRREEPAFRELVDRFSGDLFRLAVTLTGNAADAEDVLQRAYLGAWRGIGAFAGHSSLKTWLVRIVANQALKLERSKRSRLARQSAAAVAGDADDDTAAEPFPRGARVMSSDRAGRPVRAARSAQAAVDCRLDLDHMLGQLSPTSRQILLLRELDCLSYQEIADALRVPRGTVESRLFRARRQMRRRFVEYLDG